MDQEDLHWVKCNMDTWDSPDCPLPLPQPELYDASVLIPTESPQGGATRQTATCPACVAIRYKKKVIHPHSFEWGRCLRAVPPPPTSSAEMAEVVEVFEEIRRVLKPGGKCIVSMSHRLFPTKAIYAFQTLAPQDRVRLVQEYMRRAGLTGIEFIDRSPEKADPLWIIQGFNA